MTDMQWRKLNGDTGTYTGPLVNLGHGIPRQMGAHGFRRAVYDIAFGYVSGFPVRDIIPFALRSLFPQRALEAEVAYAEKVDPSHVGTVHILCPDCGYLMPATVSAEIADAEFADMGQATLVCTPDMTDVHAHMWTHAAEEAGG